MLAHPHLSIGIAKQHAESVTFVKNNRPFLNYQQEVTNGTGK